jgi:hypothetical protein
MKKLYVLAGVLAMIGAPALQAAMDITLQQNTSSVNGYSAGNGGEFRATGTILSANPTLVGYSALTSGAGYFQTFCIEHNEYFTPGNTYNVTISSRAMYGGQPPGGDPLSIGTAYLYSQFAAGTLAGYNYAYGANRITTAGDLQKAIWWLEGEVNGVKNSFVLAAEAALGLDDTTVQQDANGAYNVVALNLGSPGAVQDQLFILPVPEAGTVVAGVLLLLPLGASTLRILRKRAV